MQKRTKVFLTVAALSLAGGAGLAGAAVSGDDDAPITGDALEQAMAAALAETGGGEVTETEIGDDEAFYEVEVRMPDGRQIDVHLDKAFKVTAQDVESADDDDLDGDDEADEADDVPLTGTDLERATAAALAHTGGGEVTETELDDDEGVYEVEVRMSDGRQIDVHLDKDFKVVGEDVETAADDDDD